MIGRLLILYRSQRVLVIVGILLGHLLLGTGFIEAVIMEIQSRTAGQNRESNACDKDIAGQKLLAVINF